jgi:hypothetical protein
MKYLFILLMLASNLALADECVVRSATRVDDKESVSVESVTICAEGQTVNNHVRIGDTILENEVGKSKVTKYFTHQNARCRMFTERYAVERVLRVYHGVICQTDDKGPNWIVVDKW